MTTPPTETLPGSQISAAPEMTAAAALNDYAERIPRSRIILSSMIGTTIEFYDFYVYATAAVAVFPALFFPKADATAALLSSFATFGLAFIARPLGSLIFGHFGDRVGRKATLVASLLTMGIATFLIGLLPTYVQAGVWAPAMLSILRFCQGLGLGGEWSGAVLLATETAPKGKRGWAGMWPQLGAPLGFLLANGLFLILVHALNHTEGALDGDFMVWGWRIPFLLSIVMVILGLYVRMKLEETPVFQHAVTHGKRVASPSRKHFALPGGPSFSPLSSWWVPTPFSTSPPRGCSPTGSPNPTMVDWEYPTGNSSHCSLLGFSFSLREYPYPTGYQTNMGVGNHYSLSRRSLFSTALLSAHGFPPQQPKGTF